MAGTTRNLGNGVRVEGGSTVGPVVVSTKLDLPWRPRAGQFVGTAVTWDDQLLEVLAVERGAGGVRWQLAPWPEGEAVRNIDRLDSERIESLHRETTEVNKSRTLRAWLVLLSPMTGLFPSPVQRHWEISHNFPGVRATLISAVVELIVGTWWIIHPGPVLLRFFGWMLFAEAMVRLWSALSQDEPMGSFLMVPLGWMTGRGKADPGPPGPRFEVIRWAPGDSSLALATSESREDWQVDGILRFRDSLWRLIERAPGGGRAVYHFLEAPADSPVTLSLAPPVRKEPQRERGRGWVHDTSRFVLLSFAPRRFQERLAPKLNLGIRTLTWISAAVELFGGAVNLVGPAPKDALTGLDLMFVIEGASRLVWVAVTGLPVGSLLGLPFINLYERWLRSELSSSEE